MSRTFLVIKPKGNSQMNARHNHTCTVTAPQEATFTRSAWNRYLNRW